MRFFQLVGQSAEEYQDFIPPVAETSIVVRNSNLINYFPNDMRYFDLAIHHSNSVSSFCLKGSLFWCRSFSKEKRSILALDIWWGVGASDGKESAGLKRMTPSSLIPWTPPFIARPVSKGSKWSEKLTLCNINLRLFFANGIGFKVEPNAGRDSLQFAVVPYK